MKPALHGLTMGLLAFFAACTFVRGQADPPPPADGTSVSAATGGAKTAAVTEAGKTVAVPAEEEPAGGVGAKIGNFLRTAVTHPATISIAIVILSWLIGRLLSQRLRMADYSWKIGLVAFTVLASAAISWAGISNAILRMNGGQPSGTELKFGIDLRGGVNLIYGYKQWEDTKDEINIEKLVDGLRKRIDPNGTKQIVVRQAGADQVEIVVPGVNEDEIADIKRSMTELGTLEFRILADAGEAPHVPLGKIALDQALTPAGIKSIRSDPSDTESTTLARWIKLDPDVVKNFYEVRKDANGNLFYEVRKDSDGANVEEFDSRRGQTERTSASGKFLRILHKDEIAPAITPFHEIVESNAQGGMRYKAGYLVEILVFLDSGELLVTGENLAQVFPELDEFLNPSVGFLFDSAGGRRFGQLTSKYQPREKFKFHLAVVLNDEVSSAPTINSIINERGTITGYSKDKNGELERNRVVKVLQAGKLEARLMETPLREFRQDATLGQDTINKSVVSMSVAMGLVFLFMLIYYGFAGVVACIALLLNILLLVASMIAINAALTMEGFAGMVLTVGMAVDSNVLIYERIREEVARGAALRMAIRNGFGKALSAIIDSNLTTILTAIILFAIGTEQLRGFAVTLILGLLISMFTAVFCSRLLFDIAERNGWLKEVRMLKFFEKTNFDFLGVKGPAIAASLIIILAGLGAVYARGKGLLDIDFTGGNNVQVVFQQGKEMNVTQLRDDLVAWNREVEQATPTRVVELIEGKSKKLLVTLKLEALDRLAALDRDALSKRAGGAQAITDEEKDEENKRDKRIQELKDDHKLGVAVEKDVDALFSEQLAKRDGEVRAEFYRLALLDDMTVTLTRVNMTVKGETIEQQRPFVSTSNHSQPAVEGIVETVFQGKLAVNGFDSAQEPELLAAEASTAEKPGPAEKPAAGKSDGKIDGKTPGATKTAEPEKTKTGAGKTESSKTEPVKTTPAKTDAAKTDATKTVPGKTDSGKTSARRPRDAMFYVSHRDAMEWDGLLLAQADTAKTDATKTDSSKIGDVKTGEVKTPAEADGQAKKPAVVTFRVRFKDKISKATVQNAVRLAAKEENVAQTAIAVKPARPTEDATVNQATQEWNVELPTDAATAKKVLSRVDKIMGEQPLFPATNNFGTLVSNKMQWDGIVAVAASWAGILIYLWIRFQKVSFGVAAVVALVHDVLVALAFMAFSYFLPTGIPYIDPFKINLGVLAAFLTLIGYSVNDTIVIFDRVREIKGKAHDLTAEMINRAVNETLSRTIITSGLTFLVVIAQFFFGGQSIHAFAFCLVIGLIAGTYSTIYIASPVLLWMSKSTARRPSQSAARPSEYAAGS